VKNVFVYYHISFHQLSSTPNGNGFIKENALEMRV